MVDNSAHIDLTGGLPDSRLSESLRKRREIPGPAGQFYERIFCANCGANGGAVTKGWAEHCFYICDKCEAHGVEAELTLRKATALVLPDELVRNTPDPTLVG